MAKYVLEAMTARFGEAIVRTETYRGDDVAVVQAAKLVEIATWLRDDPKMSFDSPVFVTCIDRLDWAPVAGTAWREGEPRFEVCFQLRSLLHRHRVRLSDRVLGAREHHDVAASPVRAELDGDAKRPERLGGGLGGVDEPTARRPSARPVDASASAHGPSLRQAGERAATASRRLLPRRRRARGPHRTRRDVRASSGRNASCLPLPP